MMPSSALAHPEFWEDAKLWSDVAESLPNYRLSKFQPLMPAWVEQEVVADYLLSVKGAQDWAQNLSRQPSAASLNKS